MKRHRAEVKSFGLHAVFAVALVVVGLVSLLYLAQTSVVAGTGYDVKGLENQKAQWQIKNEQLRMKIAQLRALERVETEAASRLKMGPPTKVIFVPVETQTTAPDSRTAPGTAAQPDSRNVSKGVSR